MSSFFTRHKQSGLQLQRNAELQRTKKVLQFFTEKTTTATSSSTASSSSWKSALQGLAKTHRQGVPVHSDNLSPLIESAPNFNIAKNIFFTTHSKLKVRWSDRTKEIMMKRAADFGEWEFSLGFLSNAISASSSSKSYSKNKPRSVPGVYAQMLTDQTVRSLAKSSNSSNTNWAIALATVSMMRNPQKEHMWKKEDLFGKRRSKRNWDDDENDDYVSAAPSSSSSNLLPLQSSSSTNYSASSESLPPPTRPRIDASPELMQSLMLALGKGDRWVESISLLQILDRQLIPVTNSTFESAIRACYSKKKHNEVIAIVKKIMIAQKSTLREPVARLTMRSLEASTSTSKSSFGLPSINGPAANHWITSIQIFQALADQGLALTRQTYESPIRCCVASGKWESAAKLVAEMRRDGVTAGTNVIESVLSSKLAYGCQTSGQAWKLFDSLAVVSQKQKMMSDDAAPIIEKNTRTYNSLLAAAVQDMNFKLVEKVLRDMQRFEILHDKETKKWLLRAAYFRQTWERVLKNFLMLRRDVLMELKGAETFGFDVWPAEYELDDDIARMVLEACEMIGLSDPVSRSIAEAVLTAKTQNNDDGNDDENNNSSQKLLPDSTTDNKKTAVFSTTTKHFSDQQILNDLTKRMDSLRDRLRQNELGKKAELPGGSKVVSKWGSVDDEFVLGVDEMLNEGDDGESKTDAVDENNDDDEYNINERADDLFASIPAPTKKRK